MGEVSLGFPMPICLLGLGPGTDFSGRKKEPFLWNTRLSLVVFGKAEQELWKAPSFCTSPGQHFKLCLEHVCTAQGWDPLLRPIRNPGAVTGHNSEITMTDFLSSPFLSSDLSKYQPSTVTPVGDGPGCSSAIYRITLLTTLFHTLDSNAWIWGVYIPVFLGSLPLTYLLTSTLIFSVNLAPTQGDTIRDAGVILIISTGAAPLSSTSLTAFHCLFFVWPMHWLGLYYSLQNWWCLC